MADAGGLAERYGWPNAIVAAAPLDAPDAAEILAAQAAFPPVRSIRHKPGHRIWQDAVGRTRTLMLDETWRRCFARRADHGQHFDLQTPWQTVDEAVALARGFPATTIILNHTGLPSDRSAEGLVGGRAAIGRLADCSNVMVKISGIGVPGDRWTVAANGRIVRETIALFGAQRAMVGSNFPIDSLCATYAEVFGGFREIVADMLPADQEALFRGTARRIYCTA